MSFEKTFNRALTPSRPGESNTADCDKSRVVRWPCVVKEPAHAEKQHAREPGDLQNISDQPGTRPVREGEKLCGGRARSGGVGLRCSTDEPAEQRGAILYGGWGGKGADQGEHRAIQHEPDTERGTSVPGIERCAASSQGKEVIVFSFCCGYRCCRFRV